MNTLRTTSLILAMLGAAALSAREVPGLPELHASGSANESGRAAPCSPATASNELDLNNVRARIETGGNMWEDRTGSSGPAYEAVSYTHLTLPTNREV